MLIKSLISKYITPLASTLSTTNRNSSPSVSAFSATAVLATVKSTKNRFFTKRHGLTGFYESHIGIGYPTPGTLSYAWSFGSLSGLCLVSQILTGLFLSMSYTGHVEYAFDSIEYLSREIPMAITVRYLHANGASMFFVFLYLHIFRTIWYQAHFRNKAAWFTGIVIYFLAMAVAFLGYVLPYGQMSYWGATVITNLFTVLPYGAGEALVEWMWGGFSVCAPTLTRFYSWHYLLPLVMLVVVIAHLLLLHETGSSAPVVGRPEDGEPVGFYPMYFVKDLVTLIGFCLMTAILAFFAPDLLGHPDNYVAANPYVTPAHIVPEWYFLPFYAILRAIPHKAAGVGLMAAAIFVLAILPLCQRVSSNFAPTVRNINRLWALNFVALGILGACPAEYPYTPAAQLCTVLYFVLLALPVVIRLVGESCRINHHMGFQAMSQPGKRVRIRPTQAAPRLLKAKAALPFLMRK